MIGKILNFFSRITVRLLAFNILIVFLPIAAMLYLDTYEKQLLRSLEHALVQQGRILAAAMAGQDPLEEVGVRSILEQLEQRHEARLRVVDSRGNLLGDSSRLGPRREELLRTEEHTALPTEQRLLYRIAIYPIQLYRRLFRPPEPPLESAEFYINTDILLGPEILEALAGRYGAMTRISSGGQRSVTLYSAIPIRNGEEVVGAVLVSQSTYRILRDLYELRLEIFTIFLISLAAAVALSLLSSTTIAVPVRRLRRQAREILDHRGRLRGLIRFNSRRDEIGDLSRALEEMTRNLQEHIEFVESFAADISHEFRNPLASIRSAAELVGHTPSLEDRDRFLHLIQKEVGRMQHLLGGVREISRIDAQLEDEERAAVDVVEMARQVVEGKKLRGVSPVAIQILEQTPSLTVCMAPGRLSQVLENLLDNAFSFARTGVWITLARDHGSGVIVCEDDGPGIPSQHLEKIFDRFFSYRDNQEDHLGLGLAIVKAVVQGYGGTVTAERGLRGARFTVRLPLTGE